MLLKKSTRVRYLYLLYGLIRAFMAHLLDPNHCNQTHALNPEHDPSHPENELRCSNMASPAKRLTCHHVSFRLYECATILLSDHFACKPGIARHADRTFHDMLIGHSKTCSSSDSHLASILGIVPCSRLACHQLAAQAATSAAGYATIAAAAATA